MVYVQNGKILEDRPFGFKSITDFFMGIILFVIYFFKTLFGLESGSNSSYGGLRPGGGGSGPGGRGNGPGGGPGGGPRGPKTIGRISSIQDNSVPGCGCSG